MSSDECGMRGAIRALEVLRALNLRNGATIVELYRMTGISRPALYRVVRTLCASGYLEADRDRDGFHLTPLVRQLSEGFDDDAWITDIAGPVLDHLQQEVIWPTDLFAFHNDSMVMRRTTRRASPWTIDRAMVGLHIPLLITAVGRAYLAFSAPNVRDGILHRLAESQRPDDAIANDRHAVELMLTEVRRQGYATREQGFMRETGSIAVPVLLNGVAQCSVAITYISSALNAQEAARRYGDRLKVAASEISRAFNRSGKTDTRSAPLQKRTARAETTSVSAKRTMRR